MITDKVQEVHAGTSASDRETASHSGLDHLRTSLFTSSTKRRILELENLYAQITAQELLLHDETTVLYHLTATCSYYDDRASRQAASACLRALVRSRYGSTHLQNIADILHGERKKAVYAPSALAVLVQWCSDILGELASSCPQLWAPYGLHVVESQADLLDKALASITRDKRSRQKCVTIQSRKGIRRIAKSRSLGPAAIVQVIDMLTAKSTLSKSFNAAFLGEIAGVCDRIPGAMNILREKTTCYIAYFVRELLGCRVPLPTHVVHGLDSFFASSASTADVLECELAPSLERAVLRAPEVVLIGLLPAVIQAVQPTVDLSGSLKKHLLKPLLSAVKSSNQAVREGSLLAFQGVASRCMDSTVARECAAEITKLLVETKSAEHRAIYSHMISAITSQICPSDQVASDMATIASKEVNEHALDAEVNMLRAQIHAALSQGQKPADSLVRAFVHGLEDNKVLVQRIWAIGFGDLVWSLPADRISVPLASKPTDEMFQTLLKFTDEIVLNSVSIAQVGAPTAAAIALAVQLSRINSIDSANKSSALLQNALRLDGKQSFLTNHRIYSKLNTPEDIIWTIRALQSVAEKSDVAADGPWTQAIIFLNTSISTSSKARQEVEGCLARLCLRKPDVIPKAVIQGLWIWLKNLFLEEKDTPAMASRTGRERLYQIFRTLSIAFKAMLATDQTGTRDIVYDHLIRLLVLCRRPLIPRVDWIQLCLRSTVDPKSLVSWRASQCMDEANSRARERSNLYETSIFQAACTAVAELAFIAPDIITPMLADCLGSDLDPEQLDNVGPTEAAIFRTQEGVAFVDVLAQNSQILMPIKGNTKDYDVLKWEQELREQVAKKSGQQRKLTADEQTKIKAQLSKESETRSKVKVVEHKLRRGIGYIASLARGPPSDSEAWMAPAIRCLIGVITRGAGLLVGDAGASAYLACADKISPRLGTLREFIGVATLRAQGASQLPHGLEAEDLGDLITRVLYRLRFSGEQRPFDIVSLLYILPLITLVLQKGGIGRSQGDDADEQITLAVEFLSYHADLFSSANVPRESVSRLLITALRKYAQHYRILKDCLQSICHAIAPDASVSEISAYLQACTMSETSVRSFALQAIDNNLNLEEDTFYVEIWLACHEDNMENAEIASTIWEENNLATNSNSSALILPYLAAECFSIRQATATALAACVRKHPDCYDKILGELKNMYIEKAKPRLPQLDAHGMPRKVDLRDPWESRQGIALAFQALAPSFASNDLEPFIHFLIERGPLGDKDERVRDAMVQAASSLIMQRCHDIVEKLMHVLETTLEAPDSGSQDHDHINEAAIIMYGALATHLQTADPRITKVVKRLLRTLRTPSETVQYAIANCLPPLVQNSRLEASTYVQDAMDILLHSKRYAERRGAAYGLAGIVKGTGLSALREYRILSSLRTATENKKDANQRQGAFLATELMSSILGPIFEPYVIQLVPQLLSGFGESNTDVREACLDAAKTCFRTLSSFGVKQILPILLDGLDEQAWRSKKGACDSLGAMAYLDPQQLAVSLPEIIPPLTNVLNDSHKEVRGAANRSLQRFGDVISNPEIKGQVNILLKALSDPTKYTEEALDALLKVNFMHYLDAPSLALVVRILERGLGDRSQTKRKASQVIGSLAHLTERKDIVPNLPILVFGLRVAIVDPVPGTRATASKALGSLVEKLGEDALPDLIPSLMSALKTDTGAGDRLGSAQALSEVLAGLGIGRLEETLPSILQNVSSSKASVREGFMSLFIFLPACFGNSFATYLSRIIPPILSGLADDVESIRETALRAGRLLVKNFATKAIDLLLPELQRGLADDNHRIRLSSVELVGDLLFNLTGITAKDDQDDQMEETATSAGQSLLEVLGEEKRNNILSALYISRCDTSGLVRTAAINVWKALVATPRTLREITPTLTQAIIRRLASSNMEQKLIAGNALSELIRKAGDGVIASLLPTLEEGLETTVDIDAKQGICIALRELISSASEETLEDYEPKLVTVVRTALVDSHPEVRDAAAQAFDSMQRMFGKKVIDQILPYLLGLLREDDSADNALAALLTLLTEQTRANVILPALLPTLLATPISAFNANAIASLALVAGPAMTCRLKHIIEGLIDDIVHCKDDERRMALDAALDAVLLSVDEFDGLNTMMSLMMGLVKHDDHRRRAAADNHLAHFCAQAEIDFSRYYADLIRVLLQSFDDCDADVVKAAWSALSTLTSHLSKEDMESLVMSTRQSLRQAGVPGHHLAGFLLPKGINAILPIFLQGLINGTAEQRTHAALAISEIIDKTSGDSLKPFVTQITGPLIRVVSERSVDVKAAILLTLNNLLENIPAFVRPFLPQLQRTFTKALADPSSEVLRTRAAKALGTMITLTPRIDPLIGELVAGSKTSDLGVKIAMHKALFEVISKVGNSMGEASRAAVITLIDEDSGSAEDTTAITNARLLGALIKSLSPEGASNVVKTRILSSQFSKASVLALNAVLLDSPAILTKYFAAETVAAISKGIASSDMAACENYILAAGKYLLTETSKKGYEATKSLFEALAPAVHPGQSIDSRRLALVAVRTLSRQNDDLIRPHLPLLASPVFASVRDPIIPIKLAAEAAFLALFRVVDEESAVFDKYLNGPGASLPVGVKRSMQDYFKRVAMRLGAQARERREAEGVQNGLGLSNDEQEDEREIWSVGKVNLGETDFEL